MTSSPARRSVTAKLRIDFANDGQPADVYLYEVDSSAGPGCSLKYYDTAPNDTASPHHAQLATMQGLDLTDAYTRRTCEDVEPRWFSLQGAPLSRNPVERVHRRRKASRANTTSST